MTDAILSFVVCQSPLQSVFLFKPQHRFSLCIQKNTQNWVAACYTWWISSPLPHYRSILSGDLEGYDSCGQTRLSFLATAPAAASLKLRAGSLAACSKIINYIKFTWIFHPCRAYSKGYLGAKFTLERLSRVSFRAVRWLETATPSISASTSAFRSKPVSLLWPREPDLCAR